MTASAHPDLLDRLSAAPAEVDRLLAEPGRPLDVVAWLSTHLAALEHSVYAVAGRSLPDGAELVVELRRTAHELVALLRGFERRHSGDFLASQLDADTMVDHLRELLTVRREQEQRLITGLGGVLDEPAQRRLMGEYDEALRHAPTRPHTHLTHLGVLNPAMYLLERVRDKLLDTMDGRHVPVPRVARRYVKPGRWGSYWLGQQYEFPAANDVPAAADPPPGEAA